MAVYLARSCPLCRNYFGIVIGEPKTESNVHTRSLRYMRIRIQLDPVSRLWPIKFHQVQSWMH